MVLLFSGVMAFFMNRVRDEPDSIINHVILLIVASMPYLYMVGRFSKNLAFDSMLFYLLWLVGFWAVMLFTPAADKLNGMQMLGIGISVMGLAMFKVFSS